MSNGDDRLDELREQKLRELQEQQGGGGDGGEGGQEAQARQEAAEAQKQALLRQALSDGARKRLNTIRMSKPEFAEQVEQQVLALSQSGRLQGQIDDEQMKRLLQELKPDSKSFDIRRR